MAFKAFAEVVDGLFASPLYADDADDVMATLQKLARHAETDAFRAACDDDIHSTLLKGRPFGQIADKILERLPENVYVSFDIDGLDPSLCPNTGTPVPGGLSFPQVSYLLEVVAKSGRRIIGFDLCEVSSGDQNSEWDANVGARVLYKLCGAAVHSNQIPYQWSPTR